MKAAGRIGPGGVVVVRVTTDHSTLHPEVWQAQQFGRFGFPLGKQVVHVSLAVVVTSRARVVRDAIRAGPHGVTEIASVRFHNA